MTHEIGELSEPRELSPEERVLTAWLLHHGIAEGVDFLGQLSQAKVIANCKCGCASIDFSINGKRPQTFAMRVLSDFQWKDEKGQLFGAMVFEQDDLLAGLELWSIDGIATAYGLPSVDVLVPYGTPDHASSKLLHFKYVREAMGPLPKIIKLKKTLRL